MGYWLRGSSPYPFIYGTGEVAEAWAKRDPRVFIIHRPRKTGLGTAYIAGFKRALSLGAKRVIIMDADFSHHPRYIPTLLARSESADLVIGSRYVDRGGTLNCRLGRRALSRSDNIFARIALGLKATIAPPVFAATAERCWNR